MSVQTEPIDVTRNTVVCHNWTVCHSPANIIIHSYSVVSCTWLRGHRDGEA